jgi:hypothetical protein
LWRAPEDFEGLEGADFFGELDQAIEAQEQFGELGEVLDVGRHGSQLVVPQVLHSPFVVSKQRHTTPRHTL